MIFFNMVSDEELEAYEKEYLKRLEQKKASSNNANLFGNQKSLLPNCFSCGEEIESGSNEEIHAYFSSPTEKKVKVFYIFNTTTVNPIPKIKNFGC